MRRVLIAVIVIAVALPLCGAETSPTKRQRELIVELLQLTSGATTTKAVMNTMLAQSEKQFIAQAEAKGYAPSDLEERKELYALLHEELAGIDLSAALSEAAIAIYAKHYTERELADLVAFYRSPAGRKSIQVLPEIVRESAEASTQNLGPLLDEALSRAVDRQGEKRRPWRRTMSDMRTIAVALSAYSSEKLDLKYPPGDFQALKRLLVPEYVKTLPEKDAWGTPYAYAASADGLHSRIVSAGADRKFERDSLRVFAPAGGKPRELVYPEQLDSDLINEDGIFVQYPVEQKR